MKYFLSKLETAVNNAIFNLLLFCTMPCMSADTWPQFGGTSRLHTVDSPPAPVTRYSVIWKQPLGPGTSAIVSDGKLLFTMHSQPDAKDKGKGVEIVTAHDASTGKLLWKHQSPVSRLTKQQSFSGDPIRPQATPAIHRGKLCTLGYTGLVHCFDAETGSVLWKYELVKEFGATPVQFGFAASPLIFEDSFILHAGGTQTTLLRLEASTGKVRWKAEAAEPSYASPILAHFFSQTQIIQSTRDHILGIHPETGSTLWKYAMPEAGLTNVPTPLPLPGNRLIVSGQGIQGTRLLQLEKLQDNYQFKQLWHNSKVPFFYCNFHVLDGMLIGNANKIMTALELSTGKELWRERGYPESNQLRVGNTFHILSGEGKLSLCRFSSKGVENLLSEQVTKGRCWTIPTLIGTTMYLRDQETLFAIRLQ